MRKAIHEGLIERFTEHDLRAKHATGTDEQGFGASTNLQHSDRRTTEVDLRANKVLRVSTLGAEELISY